MPRKKNESALPNFSVNNPQHLDYLRDVFRVKLNKLDDLLKLELADLTRILKNSLSDKFNKNYITQLTAKSISNRMFDGTLTW